MLVAGLGLGAALTVELVSPSLPVASDDPASTPAPTPTADPAQDPAATPEAVPASAMPAAEQARVEELRALEASIRWRQSRAVGAPNDGRLVSGVLLPAEGEHFFTWDAPNQTSPSPDWRRWGTDRLVRAVLRVSHEFAAAHPHAPRLTVGDLSRPEGGRFGQEYGGLGHASHQNGLDVDIYYPRRDRAEREPDSPAGIDHALAQDLVDRFVAAGAEKVFVGPNTRLRGPQRIVQPLRYHDDHLHVRLRPA